MSSSCVAEHTKYLQAKAAYIAARDMMQTGGGTSVSGYDFICHNMPLSINWKLEDFTEDRMIGRGASDPTLEWHGDDATLEMWRGVLKVPTSIPKKSWERWYTQCEELRVMHDDVAPRLRDLGVVVTFVPNIFDGDEKHYYTDFALEYAPIINQEAKTAEIRCDIIFHVDADCRNILSRQIDTMLYVRESSFKSIGGGKSFREKIDLIAAELEVAGRDFDGIESEYTQLDKILQYFDLRIVLQKMKMC
jgi:hypothetical protein